MTRPNRILYLLLPLALGLGSMAVPGRAQQAPQGRFAFADTTLLRDTLGLHFDQLFPLADSLGMLPDSLRAISIRYRYSLAQLLTLADSLNVVVDSVGPTLWRERFNPLATGVRQARTFGYNTTYNIVRNGTTWENSSDYGLPAGRLLVSGTTYVRIVRNSAGGRTNLDHERTLSTRADWRLSRKLSAGAVANLSRTDNGTRGSLYNLSTSTDRFDISARSLTQPIRGLTSDVNLSTGLLNIAGSNEEKRGLSGDLTGRVRYTGAKWLTEDVTGTVSGNLSRTRLPGALERSNTQDLSTSMRGTLGVFPNAPVGANINVSARDNRVETPADSGLIQQVKSGGTGLDLSLRARLDNDRSVSVTQRFSTSRQASAISPTTQNSKDDEGLTVSARYGLGSIALDASFGRTLSTTEYPRRGGASGGYGEDRDSRSVDATLNWTVSPRISARANGSVRLDRARYSVIGAFTNLPVPRDQYEQSYRMEGRYTHSQRFNSGLGLEVGRSLLVNIAASSTASNNEVRRYRADWSWTFRLLPGLTATQKNQLTADYTYYTFLDPSADRLSLLYSTFTTLNADVTPRLHIDITQDFRYQPTGGFAPLDSPLDDGNSYFSQADESRSSILRAIMTYSLAHSLSLSVSPSYNASDRKSFVDGVAVPQSGARSLNVAGSANLNFSIGRRGQLTGSLARSFNTDRRITYVSGVPGNQPASEIDYWTGNLQLSWAL